MLTLKVHSFISRNFVCCASFCSFNCTRRHSSFLEVLVITTGCMFLHIFISVNFSCKLSIFKQLRKQFYKNHTTSLIQIPHPKTQNEVPRATVLIEIYTEHLTFGKSHLIKAIHNPGLFFGCSHPFTITMFRKYLFLIYESTLCLTFALDYKPGARHQRDINQKLTINYGRKRSKHHQHPEAYQGAT